MVPSRCPLLEAAAPTAAPAGRSTRGFSSLIPHRNVAPGSGIRDHRLILPLPLHPARCVCFCQQHAGLAVGYRSKTNTSAAIRIYRKPNEKNNYPYDKHRKRRRVEQNLTRWTPVLRHKFDTFSHPYCSPLPKRCKNTLQLRTICPGSVWLFYPNLSRVASNPPCAPGDCWGGSRT